MPGSPLEWRDDSSTVRKERYFYHWSALHRKWGRTSTFPRDREEVKIKKIWGLGGSSSQKGEWNWASRMLEGSQCSHNMCSPQTCPGPPELWSEVRLFPGQPPAVTEAGGGQGLISTRDFLLTRQSASSLLWKWSLGQMASSVLSSQLPNPSPLPSVIAPRELTSSRDPSSLPLPKFLHQWDFL